MGEPRVSVALNPEAVEAAAKALGEFIERPNEAGLSDAELDSLAAEQIIGVYLSHPASGLVRRDELERAERERDEWRLERDLLRGRIEEIAGELHDAIGYVAADQSEAALDVLTRLEATALGLEAAEEIIDLREPERLRDEVERLRAAAKRVLEADMRGVRDLDALNALEDAAGFSQQGQRRRFPAGNQQERADCPTCGDAVFAPLMEELAGLRAELERAEAELRQAREALEDIARHPGYGALSMRDRAEKALAGEKENG